MAPKPFTVLNVKQGSPEWLQARSGVLTASRAYEAFRKTVKGEWRAERGNYRTELVLDRTTGIPSAPPKFVTRAMQNGVDREAKAIRVYENVHGIITRTVGFVLDNEFPIGCSPDAVVGDFEGLVQIKCPEAATHYETIAGQRSATKAAIPPEYVAQLRHEMFVTGADWIDYVSYHPAFPVKVQLLTIRVLRDDLGLSEYANDVKAFLAEVDAECEQIAEWAR